MPNIVHMESGDLHACLNACVAAGAAVSCNFSKEAVRLEVTSRNQNLGTGATEGCLLSYSVLMYVQGELVQKPLQVLLQRTSVTCCTDYLDWAYDRIQSLAVVPKAVVVLQLPVGQQLAY